MHAMKCNPTKLLFWEKSINLKSFKFLRKTGCYIGCVSCSTSFRPCRLGAHLSTATISVSCTYPPTSFSINAPSMWRLIFILSERRLPSVKSASFMSRRHRSSPTSSRRDSPTQCLMSFDPVSISAVAEL
jgi:hypothetical protein